MSWSGHCVQLGRLARVMTPRSNPVISSRRTLNSIVEFAKSLPHRLTASAEMGCQERLGYGRKRTAAFGTATAVAFIRIVHISRGTEMRSATAVTGRASLIESIGAIPGARNAIRMPSGLIRRLGLSSAARKRGPDWLGMSRTPLNN